MGIEILRRLAHRGAAGSDPVLRATARASSSTSRTPTTSGRSAHAGIELPLRGRLRRRAVLPLARPRARAPPRCAPSRTPSATTTRRSSAGATSPSTRACRPAGARVDARLQAAVHRAHVPGRASFERTLFMIRKRAGRRASEAGLPGFYIASLSSKTVVYKGLALPERLDAFYLDLRRRRDAQQARARALALQHQHVPHLGARAPVPAHRAQRRDQHAARQPDVDGARASRCSRARRSASTWPTSSRSSGPGGSDSASLDNLVDFLVAGGRSLPHVMMMLVPGGLGGAARDAARAARLLRVPRVARRAVGRAGGARSSPTAATSARRSTATACAR